MFIPYVLRFTQIAPNRSASKQGSRMKRACFFMSGIVTGYFRQMGRV
jgi:predicted hydrocarbon binding protein